MKIQDILDRKGGKVVTIAQDARVHEAILRLNEHRIGGLIVTGENDATVGIVARSKNRLAWPGDDAGPSACAQDRRDANLVDEPQAQEVATLGAGYRRILSAPDCRIRIAAGHAGRTANNRFDVDRPSRRIRCRFYRFVWIRFLRESVPDWQPVGAGCAT